MSKVSVMYEGKKYSVGVKELSPQSKISIATDAPDQLLEASKADGQDVSLNKETIDYLITVVEEVTDFEKDEIEKLPTELLLDLSASVLEEIFSDSQQSDKKNRVKRVRCTEEFVECLFTEKMAIVAGMPDNASFKNFEYDPARNEFNFIFESSEWEPVDEGGEIPLHEAYTVAFGDSDKELESAKFSHKRDV